MVNSTLPLILGVIRAPFLPLALLSILQPIALLLSAGYPPDPLLFTVIGAIALTAHISVNTLNEVADYRSGLDLATERTPFSGGSGTLPQQSHFLPRAVQIGWGAVVLTVLLGLWLVAQAGWELLLFGVPGVVIILLYTPLLTRYPLLCLVAPGLAFGPLMMFGTHYLLTGSLTLDVVLLAGMSFFFVNNLLLLNQYPDAAVDARFGRNHLIIAYGSAVGAWVYTLFALAAYLLLLYAVWSHHLPLGSLLGLVTLPLAWRTVQALQQWHPQPLLLRPYLGQNVVVALLTPLLIVVGFWL